MISKNHQKEEENENDKAKRKYEIRKISPSKKNIS